MDVFTYKPKNSEEKLAQVHEIIVPDGVKWRHSLNDFKQLERISLSYREYLTAKGFGCDNKGKVVLRVPEKRDLMMNEEVQRVIGVVTPLYTAARQPDGQIHPLFLSFELASRAWSEELTLACLAVTGLTQKIFLPEDVRDCLPEYVYRSLAKLCVPQESIYALARVIRDDEILSDVMMIRKAVEESYDITANMDLYDAIAEVTHFDIDVGLEFTGDVSIEGNVLQGFNGTGRLMKCGYHIYGRSTPALNREIIRLTSNYLEDREPQPPSPRLLFLKFFEQHWFQRDGSMGLLWSYPNGTVYAEGYMEDYCTVTTVLTELCFLARCFPALELYVYFSAPKPEKKVRTENFMGLFFTLHKGKVRVEYGCPAEISQHRADDTVAEYADRQRNGEPLLTDEERERIYTLNRYDIKKYEETASPRERLRQYGMQHLKWVIEQYMNEHYGWRPEDPCDIELRKSQILEYLFRYDPDKMKIYLEEKGCY